MPSAPGDLRERFWSKVKVGEEGECWDWVPDTKGTNFRPGGRVTAPVRAHRFAYILEVGSLPKGVHLRHTCGNPRCCNPSHIQGPEVVKHVRRKRVSLEVRQAVRAAHSEGVALPELRERYDLQVVTMLQILYGNA